MWSRAVTEELLQTGLELLWSFQFWVPFNPSSQLGEHAIDVFMRVPGLKVVQLSRLQLAQPHPGTYHTDHSVVFGFFAAVVGLQVQVYA